MRKGAISYWSRGVMLVLSVCGWMTAKPAFAETYLPRYKKSKDEDKDRSVTSEEQDEKRTACHGRFRR